ncbi:MAG: terminase large subunit domain-containing protein [Gemmataceae bacterium]
MSRKTPITVAQAAALALDPSGILRAQGIEPDAWQREFLLCEDRHIALCCCRGAGKSRATSAKALHRALFRPGSLILLVSRSQRQAMELFRYCRDGYRALGKPVPLTKETETQYEFGNGSRIVCLPGKEANIRAFQGVALLIKDEAARIPDDLNRAVTPMLSISQGQEIDLSTPFGQRGFFHRKWTDAALPLRRFQIDWRRCPRHSAAFIGRERHEHGDSWVRQEYECSFEAMSGLVYPDFEARTYCLTEELFGRQVGGIDFGFRNPFAALWGVYNPESDILTVRDERYLRETGLHEHAAALPPRVEWSADPAHPTEIRELRRAGHLVHKADNRIEAGIAAVRARLETGRLRVITRRCPNLLAEAALYRYPGPGEGRGERTESPVDADNHALAALRYLVARLDRHFIQAYVRRTNIREADCPREQPDAEQTVSEAAAALYGARLRPRRPWTDDPALWTPLN